MLRFNFRRIISRPISLLPLVLSAIAIYPVSAANAEPFRTEGANDYYFELESGTTFTLRTYAQQYGIDSQLWLYNSANTVVAVNDDWFGLDSYISYNVQESGVYRLRTSVCCGDPDRWYNQFYMVESDSAPTNMPTTTTSTTTTTTTTTTIAPYLNAPQNLQVISTNASKVYLSWDAPSPSNVELERYAVFGSCNNWVTGFAISTTQTIAVIEDLDSGTSCQFKVRADNDTLSVYSSFTEDVIGVTQTTTTTSTTTTTTVVPTTMLQTTTTELPTTTTTSSTVPPTTTTQIYVPLTTVATTTTAVATTTSTIPRTTLPEPSTSVASTTSTIVETPTTIASPTTTVAPTPEQVDPAVAALITTLVDKSQEEIQSAVEDIISSGVNDKEAVALATNSEVLAVLNTNQATEIFDAIDAGELSTEQANELITAVQDAPESVRSAFESEINIFGEQFGTYVPVGSKVNVSTRKAVIAATGVLFVAPTVSLPSSSSPAPAPSPSGGGGGGSDTSGSSESRKRRFGQRN